MAKEFQELYCHHCDKYVQFSLDLSIDDNYILECPNCGHKHYRVVENGKITDLRWGRDPSQNDNNWTQIASATVTATSTYDLASDTASFFTYNMWCNTSATVA